MNPAYDLFSEWLDRYFNKEISIVDFGCGSGAVLKRLPAKKIADYHGLDVNKGSIDSAKKDFGNKKTTFSLIDGDYRLGSNNETDLIIMIGVFQYMTDEEIEIFLQKANKTLKKNGEIFASTVLDYPIYKYTNLYNLFFPNRYFSKKKLINTLERHGFKVEEAIERGLFLTPFISHFFIIFVDVIDKIIYRRKGSLGPLSTFMRNFLYPLMYFELKLPINFGYTVYLRIKKN